MCKSISIDWKQWEQATLIYGFLKSMSHSFWKLHCICRTGTQFQQNLNLQLLHIVRLVRLYSFASNVQAEEITIAQSLQSQYNSHIAHPPQVGIASIQQAYQSIVKLLGTVTHLFSIAVLMSALALCNLVISLATVICYILESKVSMSHTISSTYFFVAGL